MRTQQDSVSHLPRSLLAPALLVAGLAACPGDITPPGPGVRGVTVGPTGASVTVGATLQMTASVDADPGVATTVTWSSSALTVATVGAASGLVTGVAAGSAAIRACSTAAGFTTICGSTSVQVSAAPAASIQILGASWIPPAGTTGCAPGTGPAVPITATTQVRCQISVTVRVTTDGQPLDHVNLLINGQVMASGTVPAVREASALAGTAERITPAPISADITLSMNTTQLRRVSSILVPVVFNGNAAITAQLFVVGSSTAITTPPFPAILVNEDAIVMLGTQTPQIIPASTLTATTLLPSVTDNSGNMWFTGGSTVTGAQYIAFSSKVPTAVPFTSSVCGLSNSSTVTGTAATGITLTGGFTCAGVEGANTVTGFTAPTYAPPLNGPDGTPLELFGVIVGANLLPGGGGSGSYGVTYGVPISLPSLRTDNLAPRVNLTAGPQTAYTFSFPAVQLTYNTGSFLAGTLVNLNLISGGAIQAADLCLFTHLHNTITIFSINTGATAGPFTDPFTDGRNDPCGHGIIVTGFEPSVNVPARGGITDALLTSATRSVYKATGSCDAGQIVDDVLVLQGTGPGQVNTPTQDIFSTATNFNAPFIIFGGPGFTPTNYCLRIEARDAFSKVAANVTAFTLVN